MPRLTVTLVSRNLALVLLLGVALLAVTVGLLGPSHGVGRPLGGAGLGAVALVFSTLAWAVWRGHLDVLNTQRVALLLLCTVAMAGAAALWLQVKGDEISGQGLAAGTPWMLCLEYLLFLCFPPRVAAAVALTLVATFTALPWLLSVPAAALQGSTLLMLNLGLVQLVFVAMVFGAARQLWHLAAAGPNAGLPVKGQALSVRDLVSRREGELQALLAQANQAHRTAAHHEAELRAMLDAFPGLVWRLEPSGEFGFANPHAAGLLGLRPEELVGQHAREWLGEEAFQHAVLRSRHIVASGKPVPFEANFMAQDGRVHDLLMTQFVVPAVDGQAPRIYQIGVDISDRKRAEQALEQAKADAERANLAKSRFMSRMSHELRTPLNAVLGLAQLLRVQTSHQHAEAQNSAQQQHLRSIADAGKELLALVDETMDWSRMDAGEMRVACQSVNLLDLVHAALHSVAAIARDQGVSLAPPPLRRGPQRDIWVQADPVRLRQVLLNLLSNAIKYNRAGGGVAVRVMLRDTEVQLVVQDTGPGLTAQQQAQLFQPYNRLGAESGTVPGSGVGLSIARGLTALMGGRLEARSNLGVGSEFSLWLTRVAAPAVVNTAPTGSDFGALEENHHTRGTVLYVEDNEVNVLVFQACLARRPQVKLLVARTAEAALERARQDAVELVVLDLNLPDCTGLELATQLRLVSNVGRAPMVLFTADATPQIETQARAEGFVSVWHKPFDTVRLLTEIDSLLEPVLA